MEIMSEGCSLVLFYIFVYIQELLLYLLSLSRVNHPYSFNYYFLFY